MRLFMLLILAVLIPDAKAFDPCLAVRQNAPMVKQLSLRDQARDIATSEGLPYYSVEYGDRVTQIIRNPPENVLSNAVKAEADALALADECQKGAAGSR